MFRKNLLFLLFLYSDFLYSSTNLRESCRQRVSGIYLELVNSKRVAKLFLDMLNKKNLEFKRELAKVELGLKGFKNSRFLSEKNFMNKNSLLNKKDLLELSIEENLKQISNSRDTYQKKSNELKNFSRDLNKIFEVQIKNQHDIYVSYKKKCSKYNISCSLIKKDIKNLKDLFNKGKNIPIECSKYVQQSHLPSVLEGR